MDYEYLLCGNLLILVGGIVCWFLGRRIISYPKSSFRDRTARMMRESHEFQSREALKDYKKPLLSRRLMTQGDE